MSDEASALNPFLEGLCLMYLIADRAHRVFTSGFALTFSLLSIPHTRKMIVIGQTYPNRNLQYIFPIGGSCRCIEYSICRCEFIMFRYVRYPFGVYGGSCSGIVITSLGRGSCLPCFSLVHGMCTLCHDLFALPFAIISRLYPVCGSFRLSSILFIWARAQQNLQDRFPTLYWLLKLHKHASLPILVHVQTANFMPYCC